MQISSLSVLPNRINKAPDLSVQKSLSQQTFGMKIIPTDRFINHIKERTGKQDIQILDEIRKIFRPVQKYYIGVDLTLIEPNLKDNEKRYNLIYAVNNYISYGNETDAQEARNIALALAADKINLSDKNFGTVNELLKLHKEVNLPPEVLKENKEKTISQIRLTIEKELEDMKNIMTLDDFKLYLKTHKISLAAYRKKINEFQNDDIYTNKEAMLEHQIKMRKLLLQMEG